MVTQIQSKKWREQEVLNIKVNILPLKKIYFPTFPLSDSLKEKNTVIIIIAYVWVSKNI